MTIVIDGETFDVPIILLDEECEFLDKYAERCEDGVLHRELIGAYFNYDIQFGSKATTTELARLWLKLTEPVEFHTVTVPDEDGDDFTFTAYFAGVKRSLRRKKDAQTFWKNLSAHFIARSPARTP
jgi:hypothetical protein